MDTVYPFLKSDDRRDVYRELRFLDLALEFPRLLSQSELGGGETSGRDSQLG